MNSRAARFRKGASLKMKKAELEQYAIPTLPKLELSSQVQQKGEIIENLKGSLKA